MLYIKSAGPGDPLAGSQVPVGTD